MLVMAEVHLHLCPISGRYSKIYKKTGITKWEYSLIIIRLLLQLSRSKYLRIKIGTAQSNICFAVILKTSFCHGCQKQTVLSLFSNMCTGPNGSKITQSQSPFFLIKYYKIGNLVPEMESKFSSFRLYL